MRKVILTKGLPGSGKSTWAKLQLREHPDKYKIVCKDDLRAMLDNGHWSKTNEKFVLKMRDLLILEAIDAGYSVIVSDTNLVQKHEQAIRALVDGMAIVEINDEFLSVPLDECIARDLQRPNSVGETVIRRMYNQFVAPKPADPPEHVYLAPAALIIDLDGTLALHTGRDPYDCERAEEDALNDAVAQVILEFRHLVTQPDHQILLVSGRDEKCRPATERWLHNHAISYDALWMRPRGDMRDDRIVKEEIYRRNIEGKYNVTFVLDDRDKVVAFWRSIGLTCFQVAPGDF